MSTLHCASCDEEQSLPKHCGQDMKQQAVDGVEMLVCWMGPDCGKAEIPEHHGHPMKVAG